MKNRVKFIFYFLFLCYLALLMRGAWLQFFPDNKLIVAKKKNFEKVIKLKPRRGIIYDKHGRELAISISSYSLFADPHLIKNTHKTVSRLSRLLKLPYRVLYKKLKNKNKRFVWIKRHIADKDKDTIRSWKTPGLAFLEEPKRVYPNDSLLAQVLGFVGRDGYGLEGIELSYNSVLSGEEKKVLVQKDAKGRPFLFSATGKDPIALRINGADIYLTIDSDLQFFFEKELKKVVKKYNAKSAMGVIMDPQTGAVLTMAHVPSFNLNKPFHTSQKLYRNRSVTDAFEPGSTLKTFTIVAALKKNIPPSQKYSNKGGEFFIEGHQITEAEPVTDKKVRFMDLREILSRSSNIGIAQLALDIGDSFLYQTLKDFGFGSRLGVHFPGESAGILNPTPWKKLQLATIGFGHSISTTALQIVTAYSAIASGGVLKQPYLVQTIDYKDSGKKDIFKPIVLKRVLTEREAQLLTVLLMSTISDEGTGYKAQVKGFLSAGKTGTAQVVDEKKRGYIKGHYIASFVGFIPAHKPQFVIYVAIDYPKKMFYGSVVAAPVFAHVAKYAVRQAGLIPSLIREENMLKTAHKTSPILNVTNTDTQKPSHQTPLFIGLSLRKAYKKAVDTNIKLKVIGSGKVVSTIPAVGEPLPDNRTVQIILK